MARFPVNYFLPAADLLWGVFTLVQYKATSVNQLYAFRLFVGALGGFFFPAVQWYLGCWYKRTELNRRGALFFIASQVGSMSSGYIQAGAYYSLNGTHGIEGWRWLYIICFSCTIPIEAIGFLLLPGTPDKPSSRFLTPEDIALARARMASENRQPSKPLTISIVKEVLQGWHFYILVLFAFFFSGRRRLFKQRPSHLAERDRPFRLLDKHHHHGVARCDNRLKHHLGNYRRCIRCQSTAHYCHNIFASVVLAIWNVPVVLKYFAFFLSGTADAIAAMIYAWANEICAGNAEERALVISSMNTVGNTFGAWFEISVWKTVDAPRYLIGYNWTIALDVCMLGMLFVLRHFWKREKKLATASRL